MNMSGLFPQFENLQLHSLLHTVPQVHNHSFVSIVDYLMWIGIKSIECPLY
ncbi:hypothetical protein HanPI659440_Chr02g0080071 [Helianthus annuus]|nr:hypothetical protein HanPI659440_Chr02g0080071 [Helianthus annuus]